MIPSNMRSLALRSQSGFRVFHSKRMVPLRSARFNCQCQLRSPTAPFRAHLRDTEKSFRHEIQELRKRIQDLETSAADQKLKRKEQLEKYSGDTLDEASAYNFAYAYIVGTTVGPFVLFILFGAVC